MTKLKGLAVTDAKDLERQMQAFLKEGSEEILSQLPDATMFTPVQTHKSRQDCVTLPFTALNSEEI
jgi:NifU-like protein involved in Fe-S cluster formation